MTCPHCQAPTRAHDDEYGRHHRYDEGEAARLRERVEELEGALSDLIAGGEAAINAGDWNVDGARDPDTFRWHKHVLRKSAPDPQEEKG